MSLLHQSLQLLFGVTLLLAIGCGEEQNGSVDVATEAPSTVASLPDVESLPVVPAAPQAKMSMMPKMAIPAPEDMVFKDDVESNVEVPEGLDGLTFVDTAGNRVALQAYLGQKNVILVFTEGFAGMLCPFCMTQTSRLVANYDKFAALETEILVVYPGERDHLEEFVEAAKTTGKTQVDRVPFPIVLDQKMTAVDYFDIRSKLAHPSTYVIDKAGNVLLAYVGADMSADRPSVKALLQAVTPAGDKGDK